MLPKWYFLGRPAFYSQRRPDVLGKLSPHIERAA